MLSASSLHRGPEPVIAVGERGCRERAPQCDESRGPGPAPVAAAGAVVGVAGPPGGLRDSSREAMEPREPRATIIARRVLARLEMSDDAPGKRPARRLRRPEGGDL